MWKLLARAAGDPNLFNSREVYLTWPVATLFLGNRKTNSPEDPSIHTTLIRNSSGRYLAFVFQSSMLSTSFFDFGPFVLRPAAISLFRLSSNFSTTAGLASKRLFVS